MGDYNDLLSPAEKRGGGRHSRWLFSGFSNDIDECDLHEVDFVGYPFTWERRFKSGDAAEKLDRGLGNSLWCQMFPDA